MKSIWIILCFIAVLFPCKQIELNNNSNNIELPKSISLVFTGDIMQHMPQINAAKIVGTDDYNYDSCFYYIKPYLSDADFTITNLETTLAGKPYAGYPQFSAPDQLLFAMKNAGIDIIGTANNHSCDRGEIGIKRTIEMIDSVNLDRMGTYLDYSDKIKKSPLILENNGIRLALLNYTYGTNGLPVPKNQIVNLIEKDSILLDIEKAKKLNVDKIIVYIHWGTEYQVNPDDFQKEIANFLFDNGIDYIIGSHPHVVQPMFWTRSDSSSQKDGILVYSLGNFVSNQSKINTDGGTIFKLEIEKKGNKTYIKNANYMLTWVYTPVKSGRKSYFILPARNFENDSCFMVDIYRDKLNIFINNTDKFFAENNKNIKELYPYPVDIKKIEEFINESESENRKYFDKVWKITNPSLNY